LNDEETEVREDVGRGRSQSDANDDVFSLGLVPSVAYIINQLLCCLLPTVGSAQSWTRGCM